MLRGRDQPYLRPVAGRGRGHDGGGGARRVVLAAVETVQVERGADHGRLVEVGARLERTALGEPESKKTLTIETILRERFEALVAHDEPRTIEAEIRPRRQVTIDVPDLDSDDEGGGE